jgi:hypothetical protein
MSPGGAQNSREGVQRATDDQLSRRSACDRCRAHKLRCLRDNTTNDALQPCQRCSKAGAACSTGAPLRSGRPSKSARERQTSNVNVGILRNELHLQSADPSPQTQPILSSVSSPPNDMSVGASPSWLADWQNTFQPGVMTSSGTPNASQYHSGSGTSSSQEYTFVDPFNTDIATQASNNLGANALDFGSLLDMTNMDHFGLSQDDVMDLEVDGYRLYRPQNSEPDPNIRLEKSTSDPHHAEPDIIHVQAAVDLPDTHLEIADLKEEVLRRLAELHSGLLADLNLTRSVGKGPCHATSRVSLASSQRNADGKTEANNFMIGRMFSRAEIFLSILGYFTPSNPSQSSSEIRGSVSESERSGRDQDIMDTFTSWNNDTSAAVSEHSYSQILASSIDPSRGIIRCNVPMTLSILTCYVCLLRIYRTIFSNIYTSFIAIQERKLELPPLFPGLKLGGFSPPLNLQLQILVQLSTNFMEKIEEALGVPTENGQTKSGGGILDQTSSAGLLQTMMKEEALEALDNGDGNEASLKEIMRSISRLC